MQKDLHFFGRLCRKILLEAAMLDKLIMQSSGAPVLQTAKIWILASRPKTLTATLVPILVATCLVVSISDHTQWWISLCALISATFIQIGTNFFNDALDFEKGADTPERLGPVRITQQGWVSSRAVMNAGVTCFAVAAILGIFLVVKGGLPIVLIGLLSLAMGYAYTGGPYPLAYKGLGDLFVVLFFGLIAVMGLVFLHTRTWSVEALIAGLQVGLHCAVLIAINNLRDIDGDAKVQKCTLPVRFGKTFARYEIATLIAAPYLLGLVWINYQAFWSFALPLLTAPLAVQIVRFIFANEPSEKYNHYLGKAAGLHLLFGLLLSIGLLL